jgi:hypothetical protein
MEAFITGLGLSSSAGLNAYLPLVILGIAQQTGLLDLEGKYAEAITSLPALAVFSVLLVIEMIVDKIPGIDSTNDIVNTVIRPLAGTALMFAATTGTGSEINPGVLMVMSVIAGGGSAGSVHATKAVARPAITITTGGIGNSVVSVIEDIISLVMTIFALVLPFVIIFFVVGLTFIFPWWLWERSRLAELRAQGFIR